MKHDVFISYGNQDFTIAESLCTFLEGRGIICWIAPRDVETGSNYAGEITRAMRIAKAVVVICSHTSCQSGHVKNEVTLAFNQDKRILPYCIEESPFDDDLEYFLSSRHQIRTCGDCQKDFEQIAEILGAAPIQVPQTEEQTQPVKKKGRHAIILPLVFLCVAVASVLVFRHYRSRSLTEADPAVSENAIDTFSGNIKDGHPDGLGTYVFGRPRRIDQHDPMERMAAPGESIRGNWTDGHLNYGEWYDAKGNKKEFIQLGDHPNKEADWQLGKCEKP